MHAAHILLIKEQHSCGLCSTKADSQRRCHSCTAFHDFWVPKFRFFTAISSCHLLPLICKVAHCRFSYKTAAGADLKEQFRRLGVNA